MKPVSREFASTIGDMVMDVYEVAHSRLHGREMRPTENAQAGIFTYRHNDLFDTLSVLGVEFKWSARGHLISSQAKTLGEWTEWLNAMMMLFNKSLREAA
jgi:hypothetical protein